MAILVVTLIELLQRIFIESYHYSLCGAKLLAEQKVTALQCAMITVLSCSLLVN